MASSGSGAPFLTYEVLASAYITAAMSGDESSGPDFTEVVAAARAADGLHHPLVILAANWKAWLHPRGKDGRWLEKLSMVDIFSSSKSRLNDPKAIKRRAKIMDLTERGARVAYYSPTGQSLRPDPDAGFPDVIPADEIYTKVAKAQKPVARLDFDKTVSELGELVSDWSDEETTLTRHKLLRERMDYLVDKLVSVERPEARQAYEPQFAQTPELTDGILDEAAKHQPEVEADMREYAERYGLEMSGLEYQIKGRQSLMRKIDDVATWPDEEVTPEEAAASISDALRYTMIADASNFKDSYGRVIAAFTQDGWTSRVTDFFERQASSNSEVYVGVNATLTAPDGYTIELQFHTPESFETKMNGNHTDYELYRRAGTPDDLKEALAIRMRDRTQGVPLPEGYTSEEEEGGDNS